MIACFLASLAADSASVSSVRASSISSNNFPGYRLVRHRAWPPYLEPLLLKTGAPLN